jgi:hypothetical protein
MSTHRFLVEVEVDHWDAHDERKPDQYAAMALCAADLPLRLDGYRDLNARASITGVQAMD